MLAVRTYKQVGLGAAAITLISVVATAGFVHLATHHLLYHAGYRFAMLLAIGLPIVIAVPVSFLALSIVRKVILAVDKIENFVKFDPLTGVLTRAYFMEGVRLRFGAGGAFMLVDADHFKKINDNCGHDVGDEALRKIGRALNVTTPRGALVGRVGGEEFGIFLPGAAKSDAAAVAGALCEAVRSGRRRHRRQPGGADDQHRPRDDRARRVADADIQGGRRGALSSEGGGSRRLRVRRKVRWRPRRFRNRRPDAATNPA